MRSSRTRSFVVLAAVVFAAFALLCALVVRDRWPRPADGAKAPDSEMPIPQGELDGSPMRPSPVVLLEFGPVWEPQHYRTRDEYFRSHIAGVDFARAPGLRLAASFVGSGAGAPWSGVGLVVNPAALAAAAKGFDTAAHRRRMSVMHGTPWGDGRIDLPGKSERSALILVEGSDTELAIRLLSFASRVEAAMLDAGAKLTGREVTVSPTGGPLVTVRYEIGDRVGTIEAGMSPTQIHLGPKPETALCLRIRVQEKQK